MLYFLILIDCWLIFGPTVWAQTTQKKKLIQNCKTDGVKMYYQSHTSDLLVQNIQNGFIPVDSNRMQPL